MIQTSRGVAYAMWASLTWRRAERPRSGVRRDWTSAGKAVRYRQLERVAAVGSGP
jgi:hypothetical protein